MAERWIKWKQNLHLLYHRVIRLKGKPEEVAGGVAIGVFIGMTPTVPFHTILAVSIAFLFGRSKLAAALGVWISAPPILPLVYLLDYKLGKAIIGAGAASFVAPNLSISHFIELGWNLTYPTLIGGLITGSLFSVPAYFITQRVIILYRQRQRNRSEKFDSPSDPT